MCLLAVQYQLIPDSPILIAANREEFYERPTQPPSIQSGKPRVLCGTDLQAGGTWLGVNQHGLFIGVLNRRRANPGFPSRSRGTLCRELLKSHSAQHARDMAMEEMSSGRYDGANFVCVDAESGWVVHGGDDLNTVEMREGLNIIAGGDLNDPRDGRVDMARRLLTLQTLDSPVKFLAVASKVFARAPSPPGRPSIVIRDKDRGTVSSTLIALGKKPRDAIYQYAPNAPDRSKFEDFSPLLRDILSRGLREARTKTAGT
ncbi:MAG: NRDE family protein [Planctomycetales bacterium]|nr:NRDE family protein [Planctomycetales bacterium]